MSEQVWAARPPSRAAAFSLRLRRQNWPLLIGSLVILFVGFIAVAGPSLAPRDPLERTVVFQVNGKWLSAPFQPFSVPGFPFGTDSQGRDVLSQLLWAVRPTMITVLIVAVVRLAFGTLIGLASGWSAGRLGRTLDSMISAALAAPVLIVALAVVAVLNSNLDVWPFVIGLSLTGWAESARLVREQTRVIKGQPYIEAAHALGQSDAGILVRHVMRQIMPVTWVLFAVEISSTLLTTAALGFLGYYLSGEVWIAVGDFVVGRYSGLPDLGLMLSTLSTDIFIGPWKMLAAGSMVFITVLGFNLLAEGLRLQLNPERLNRRESRLSLAMEHVELWAEERLLRAFDWARGHVAQVIVGGVVIVAVIVGLAWRQAEAASQAEAAAVAAALPVPGNHLWATERHDPYGTYQTQAPGVDNPKFGWRFEDADGFAGGPVVSADGTIYLASKTGTLYALDDAGNKLWETALSVAPAGYPALDAEGRIYVADEEGGLSAVNPDGRIEWQTPGLGKGAATSGSVVGPDGTIYFTIAGQVRAVSAEGEPLWQVAARPTRTATPPMISPDGRLVFLREGALDASDGVRQALEQVKPVSQFLVGANSRWYFRFEHYLAEWQLTDAGATISPHINWDVQKGAFGIPSDAGVTFDNIIWLYYAADFDDPRLNWIDLDGHWLGVARYPLRPSRIIAIDRSSTFYVCGQRRGSGGECLAFKQGAKDPSWELPLPDGASVVGGALVPERLYVVLEEGVLYAIDEG